MNKLLIILPLIVIIYLLSIPVSQSRAISNMRTQSNNAIAALEGEVLQNNAVRNNCVLSSDLSRHCYYAATFIIQKQKKSFAADGWLESGVTSLINVKYPDCRLSNSAELADNGLPEHRISCHIKL
jgi:hypothetical protein